ncbi:MAG: hypothetical protein EXS59_02095 [Candidatus Taylorbacteria bacterium]|nr:hypothetical protein [Candidatus Taylorbacteria bacterium]
MVYRYLVGICGDCGIKPLFTLESSSKMDDAQVLNLFCDSLGQAGFKRLKDEDPSLIVESHEVRQFRGQEFELPEWYGVAGIDKALEGIQAGEVLVVAYTASHNSGGDYGHLLLAMQKGSRLLRHIFNGDPNVFCDGEVNWWLAFNDQMPGRRVILPPNARFWDSQVQQWVAKTELVYMD